MLDSQPGKPTLWQRLTTCITWRGGNPSLRAATISSFVLLGGIVVIAGSVGLWLSWSSSAQIAKTTKQATPAIIGLSELRSAVSDMHVAAASVAAADAIGDREQSALAKADRTNAHDRAVAAVQAYAAQPAVDGAALHTQMSRALEHALAEEPAVTTGATVLTELIDRALEVERGRLDTQRLAGENQLILYATMFLMQILLVVILAAGLSITLTRLFHSPLHRLRQQLERLAAGRYDTTGPDEPLPAEFDGALEAISTIADTMRSSEQDHEARREAMETKLREQRRVEQRLRHDAMHDSLTGLSNRPVLVTRLANCIERHRRDPGFQFALLFLDLDRFKVINDSLGHHIGDELLKETASRLDESVRGLDTVVRVDDETTARLGGDEFAILLEGIANPGRAVLIAERIQQKLAQPFSIAGHELNVSTSVGIALSEGGHDTPGDLLRCADTAMYRAKLAGGSQHAVFDDVMHAQVKQRLRLENDLRRAVEQQHFEVVYQPIIELATDQLIAFEALIRWNHSEHGIISPTDFIPVAEETGLVTQIGQWVLRESCRQLGAWRKQLPDDHRLSISVNVSPRQVGESNLIDVVKRSLRDTQLDSKHLRLEITESMLMDHGESIHEVLNGLRDLGVELHMDDFGTGYSSLSCLHNFPLDVLKIDREFITNMGDDPDYASVVRAIMTLAHSMRMRVTAEGLETAQQLALVRSLGCNYGQGYLFSKPLAPAEAWAMIQSGDTRYRQSA